jgi:molecular chaperone DnaJ
LVVQVPDKLSSEAKELLRQFDMETGNSLNAVKNMEAGDFTKEKKKDKKIKNPFNKN